MSDPVKKPLARSLGEAVGILWRAIRSDSAKKTIRKTVEHEQRGEVVLRRTTIEEVEIMNRNQESH